MQVPSENEVVGKAEPRLGLGLAEQVLVAVEDDCPRVSLLGGTPTLQLGPE